MRRELPHVSPCETRFNELASNLFALQFEHNTPYRRFCEDRDVRPETVADWRQIPAIPASAFKELDLSCLPVRQRAVVFHSSGTTAQQASRHFHNADSLAIYEASLWAWFQAHVLPDCHPPTGTCHLAILTPSPNQAPHSSLVHMFETVRRQLGAAESAFLGTLGADLTWRLDLRAALTMLRRAGDEKRPVVLLGTAFSFVHLLDHLAAQDLRFELPPGSRAMETGGYKGRARSLAKQELHSLITQRLGVPPTHIISEYGMSELSSQAYDKVLGIECRGARAEAAPRHPTPDTGPFRFPPWARAQIISPETGREVREGETGLIRVFDLANVYSVMAIQTEDLGVRRGADFELIGRAVLAEPRGCSLMAI